MTSYLILRDWIDKKKINFNTFCININAIEYLKLNPDKINWSFISLNKNVIELLKENQDKIDWNRLSTNTAIFTYDYKKNKKEF